MKRIVLLADGTGNSAGKLFKTNVWRMYQAIDLAGRPEADEARQVAYYHDGVGTSAFKPLALLGGVFGVGLKRNVLDMYRFLCRNYAAGDEIFLFGFSRGAFTVRILASLVATEGLLTCAGEEELARYAPDAYRRYRRGFKLPLWIGDRKQRYGHDDADVTVGIVDVLRNLRDMVIGASRRFGGHEQYGRVRKVEVPAIAFVGVWDTVSAYGLPVEELTRAVDDWLWPLSMPNYQLSKKVACARHALALDEERDSFQPLLWDELWERQLREKDLVKAGRLQQVWFAGVHSNVGGGYANDSLSHVPLKWMMDEARAKGLRFKPPPDWGWSLDPDPFGKRYDSRSGVAAYYRPQSRRLIAKLDPPSADTLVLQDPRYTPPGQLERIQVHESVLRRIREGTDRYAPTILPGVFEVVPSTGSAAPEAPPALQFGAEEFVFDDVWRRRIAYFATVTLSLTLAAFPLLQILWPPGSCSGPQCLLRYPIEAVGFLAPSFLGWWLDAFAARPGWFVALCVSLLLLVRFSAVLRLRIEDGMRELWALSYGLPLGADRPASLAGRAASDGINLRLPHSPERRCAGGGLDDAPQPTEPIPEPTHLEHPGSWAGWLRTRPAYQRAVQTLKWRALPDLLGFSALTVSLGALFLVATYGIVRTEFALREAFGGETAFMSVPNMDELNSKRATEPDTALFLTRWPTWPLAVEVHRGGRYRLEITVTKRWMDGRHIRSSPLGNSAFDMPWSFRLFTPVRRSLTSGWYAPVLRIDQGSWPAHLQTLAFQGECSPQPGSCGEQGQTFIAEFAAERSGRVSLFVNDAVIGPRWSVLPWQVTDGYYANNEGEAHVEIREL